MTGRCGKLKCCLTFELDQYLEAQADFPNELLSIETDKGLARHLKTDILQKKIWYKYENNIGPIFELELADVIKFLNLNKHGEKPSIEGFAEKEVPKVNMMNVGNLDQKLFTRPLLVKNNKRNPKRFHGNSNLEKRITNQ